MNIDTVIIGIIMSFVISAVSPLIEDHLGYDKEKAKMLIILGCSLILALVVYVTPAQYINQATAILGSATATYWILWKLVGKKDQIEEKVKSLM